MPKPRKTLTKTAGIGRDGSRTGPDDARPPQPGEAAVEKLPFVLPLADKPYRIGPAPDDIPHEIVRATRLAYSFVALTFGLHGTCPHRACRTSCHAGPRRCDALFPPETERIVHAMLLYCLHVPAGIALDLYETVTSRIPPEPGEGYIP